MAPGLAVKAIQRRVLTASTVESNYLATGHIQIALKTEHAHLFELFEHASVKFHVTALHSPLTFQADSQHAEHHALSSASHPSAGGYARCGSARCARAMVRRELEGWRSDSSSSDSDSTAAAAVAAAAARRRDPG